MLLSALFLVGFTPFFPILKYVLLHAASREEQWVCLGEIRAEVEAHSWVFLAHTLSTLQRRVLLPPKWVNLLCNSI